MRRLLLLVCVLLAAATFVRVVADGDGGEAAVPLTADVVPFPNGGTPLAVPEVHIGTGPWVDRLPVESVQLDPSFTSSTPGCGPVQMPVFEEGLPAGRGGTIQDCASH